MDDIPSQPEQKALNEMLEKAIKKQSQPMWWKNIKAVFLLTAYFLVLPCSMIVSFYYGHWFIGLLLAFPTFLGVGIALGGRRFTFWLLSKVNFLKK